MSVYLLVFFISFAIIIACKAADMEEMSSAVWGIITFLSCLACVLLLSSLPMVISVFIGLVVSLAAMFVAKMIRKNSEKE